MKPWQEFEKVFLIGIGGIGMSALARHFNLQGARVMGYDKTPSPLTDALEKEGIKVFFKDDYHQIPKDFRGIESTLIIYTPAIPLDSSVFNFFKSNNFYLFKRSEVLGLLSKSYKTLAVAGTHGKTTTSCLLAHILVQGKIKPTAFLGGISTDYNSNFIHGTGKWMVVEADEFDRSFLHLRPKHAVVTAMDPDHLDIYTSEEDFKKTFKEFAEQIDPIGSLTHHKSLPLNGDTYAIEDENAYYFAKNIRVKRATFRFDLHWPDGQISEGVKSRLPGRHNIENTLAAAALASKTGLEKKKIIKGIESFKGVKRRFEKIYESEKTVYIDDYAHHPKEIEAALSAASELFADKPLTVIFQPHLFSRTRDFLHEFADALNQAEEVILMDIYPAREKPIPGISSETLQKVMHHKKCLIANSQQILERLKTNPPEILLTLGAGDIDRLVPKIKEILSGE